MYKDLISIVVPVYNTEEYLVKCIESIINQTYKNLEIILINDGSSDKSGEICDYYALKDNRIRVVHKKNGGLSDARNTGIKFSRGKYIGLVDSDDYIDKFMYEKLYQRMIKDNSDLAICNFLQVDKKGNKIAHINDNLAIEDEIVSGKDILCYKINETIPTYWIVAVNKLYKAELITEIEFPYGKLHEDEFTVHKFFDKSKRVSCVKNALYYYVKHEGGIIGSKYSVKNLDGVEACLDRINYMVLHDYPLQAIRGAYFAYYSALDIAYKKSSVYDKEFKVRYNEIDKLYRKIFWKLIKNETNKLMKIRYAVNYINPYYNWKLINLLCKIRRKHD